MTGRWFQLFFIFTPTWGNDPIWINLTNIFQIAWNHQLATIWRKPPTRWFERTSSKSLVILETLQHLCWFPPLESPTHRIHAWKWYIYLSFTINFQPNVGKYSSPMEHRIHANVNICTIYVGKYTISMDHGQWCGWTNLRRWMMDPSFSSFWLPFI